MKALPLWQPWASLVGIGAKRIETRSWPSPPALVGERIAIHATRVGAPAMQQLLEDPIFGDALWEFGRTPQAISRALPRGAIVCTVRLKRCSEITAERAAVLERDHPREFAFGDYTPGRWAWVLTDLHPLPEPVPVRGHQGIFDVPDELLGIQPAQLPLIAEGS